ncbi:hypothetical protein [Rothia sp. ZJ1223]|uniref:hypothetical protein n=1 Tax=Rothia sp. ZJ1223 TaxID=2811098 RepID=UPI00195CD0FE|nr:hypothetical protein [Rothia sp. ZJ1223]MBM7051498.1 hypothetical protein [Rothia sp. ZJ1223]
MGILSNAALRTAAGAFILNSGINKWNMDEETYGYLKSMGSAATPAVNKLSNKQFGKGLSAAEITLGAALLCPLVPAKLAGLSLTAFGAGLVAMYLNTDEYTEADGIRPTQEGIPFAKDIFLVSSGLALLTSKKK